MIVLKRETPMSKRKSMSRIHFLVGLLGLSLLSAGTVNAQEKEHPRLRVLTYNIHHGQGTDGKFDLERLAKIISDLKPDVVALQEVDRRTSRASGIDQAARLGELTKMHAVFGNAMHFSGGGYGEAILSRFPMEEIVNYRLPFRFGQESRSVISARIKPDRGLPELIFAGTHLCHQSNETRTEQAQQINRLFPAQEGVPVILAGDLNARPGSDPMEVLLRDRWVDAIAPQSRIDYVLFRKRDPWRVVDVQIVDERIASDHRPVLAILEWQGESPDPQSNKSAALESDPKPAASAFPEKAMTATPAAVQGEISRWVSGKPRNVQSISSKGARSGDYTFALWVQLEGESEQFPALASSKEWEGAPTVDLLSQSNMGVTLGSGVNPGWVIALQPNGAWHWNIGNGKSRLDYLPTAARQSIVDGLWHLLAFSIDSKANEALLYYDGVNVAIYSLNGFAAEAGGHDVFIGGGRLSHRSVSGASGELEGAQIWDEKLSDQDVFELYKKRFPRADQNVPSERVDELKLLSWNIWHGGRHPGVEKGIQQVVDFIRDSGADVIAMQETYGSGPVIADRLGYYFYLRSSNLAVLSRYPIEETHDLYQPFRLGGVTLRLNEHQRMNVFSLWIHYLPAWRRDASDPAATARSLIDGEWKTRARELKEILDELQPFIDSSDKIPLIVGGDFNSPSTLDWTQATADWHNDLVVDWPVSRQMLEAGFTDTYRAIHPDPTQYETHELWNDDAQRLTYRIDYIYTHGVGVTPLASRMMNTHHKTWASDHPAVLSTLKLEAPHFGIISYNILEGFANSASQRFPVGKERQAAVSDWLMAQSPAIVGFQELNGYTQERLAEESLAWGHGYAATVKEGGYIVGLTSSEPITVIERHIEGMHHGALHARTMGVDCFVVHLSPFSYEHRQREATMIVQCVKKSIQAKRPVIVIGDFNSLSPQDIDAYEGDKLLLDRMRASDAEHDHVENLSEGQIDYSVMQIFLDAGLVDLFAKHRNSDAEPGRRRIDFILASQGLSEHSVSADWLVGEPFTSMSDHPPTSAQLAWPSPSISSAK